MGCEPHERRALRAAVEEPLEVRVELPEHERLALGVREEEQLVDERGQLRQLDVVQLAQQAAHEPESMRGGEHESMGASAG